MKKIPQIKHHTNIPSAFQYIGDYPEYRAPERNLYFYEFEGTHLIVFSFLEKDGHYVTTQAEFPLRVLPWVVRQLKCFEMPEMSGGITSDKVSNVEDIDGERIGINCGPCIGGPNIPGYSVWNSNRKDSFFDSVQELSLPTPWLDSGFRDFWRSMSEKFFPQS